MDMTHLRTGAVALTAVCWLSACSSSGTAATSPTPSPSTSTTAPPSPTTTAVPTKTGSVTPDLATLTAAAKAYFGAYNQAKLTRDTTAFRRTFKVTCKICAADAADIDVDTRLGRTLHGGETRISSPSLLKTAPGGGILIMTYHQDPSTLVDASGKTVKVYESSDVPRVYLEFQLIKRSWIVVGVVVG